MRIAVPVLLAVLTAGCAWSEAERTKFRDAVAKEAAGAAVAALKVEVSPPLKEKVAEIITGIVEKLPVDDERKAKILTAAISAVNDAIDQLISGEVVGAKLEEILKDLLDKILPEASPETSGTAGAIGGVLLAILTGGLGIKRGG